MVGGIVMNRDGVGVHYLGMNANLIFIFVLSLKVES